jgi:hypothetical protein
MPPRVFMGKRSSLFRIATGTDRAVKRRLIGASGLGVMVSRYRATATCYPAVSRR